MKSLNAEADVITCWADVSQIGTDQDLTGTQNILEEIWKFRIRNQDADFTKSNFITWGGNDYSIIRISPQIASSRWITITASRSV